MPNRNADNERDKYDHSGHSTQRRQDGDLKAPGGAAVNASARGKKQRIGSPVARPR